jgi:hypothetical protein
MNNTPELVDIPARDVLAVDGVGAPGSPAFVSAIRALVVANRGAVDIPFEGTYAQDGDPMRFDLEAPEGWHWTLLVPAPAEPKIVEPVRRRRQGARTVAQLLHRGSYEDEAPSLAALYAFVDEQGLSPAGAHTEVYLTDPNTTPPADLRTLLQVPVR